MHFHFSFYSSLLLIFFTHGLLFSVLLTVKASVRNESVHLWLAGFTFICTLNIVPWMLGHAGWYSLQPYRDVLFYFPFQNFFLLGPLIFFYTKALLNPGACFLKKDRLHLVPATLYLLYTAIMFVVDKWVLHRYFFYADGHDRDLDTWYRLAGIVSLSFYLFLSLRYYAVYKRLMIQIVSFADAVLFRWIKHYLLALTLIQICDIVFLCLYPDWGNFTNKWWYYLVFSGLFYYVAFTAYTNPVHPLFSFRLISQKPYALLLSQPGKLIAFKPVLHLTGKAEETINTISLENDLLEDEDYLLEFWKVKVLEAVLNNEMYKEPELTLIMLAKQLQTNASILSKIINRGFGLNFNDFINGYRVEAVKKKLVEEEHKRQTLLGIAFDCGFNSKTTFNRVFKKNTNLSPKAYIQQLDAQSVEHPFSSTEYNVPNHNVGRPFSPGLSTSSKITEV